MFILFIMSLLGSGWSLGSCTTTAPSPCSSPSCPSLMRPTSVRQRYLYFLLQKASGYPEIEVSSMRSFPITLFFPQTDSISTMDVIKRVVQLLSGGQHINDSDSQVSHVFIRADISFYFCKLLYRRAEHQREACILWRLHILRAHHDPHNVSSLKASNKLRLSTKLRGHQPRYFQGLSYNQTVFPSPLHRASLGLLPHFKHW